MGVIRVEHNRNYTVMSNEHLRDPRLSLRAMGLMSRMLSDSETFTHSVAGLTSVCREGREAVRKALQELEAAGYLVREQTRQSGSFSACDYTLYEHSRTPWADEPSPLPKKPTTVKPTSVSPTTVKPPQRSNSTEEVPSKNPPIVPPEGDDAAPKRTRRRRDGTKEAPDWEPEMFARFWKAYPRGEDKQAAIREWDRLRPDRALMKVMSAALARDKASDEWQRGIAIPYACRWLSHRRWEDEKRAALPPDSQQPREGGAKIRWI